jgi:phosphatidylserine decarboxylase
MKSAKKRDNTKMYQIIFYLAPGDYHRYHLPTDFLLKSRSHIVGHLAPVKVSYITKHKKVYETNERVALFGTYTYGFMSLVLVGAMNVGSMTLNYDKEFKTNDDT